MMRERFLSSRKDVYLLIAAILFGGFLFVLPSTHATGPIELHSTPLFSDPNLISYFRFEGNANDAGPNSNNGTASNVSYNSSYGEFGEGALFNGTDSSIVSATSSGITGDAAFSISAWIKLDSIPTSLSTISSFGRCTGGQLVLFGVSGKSTGDLGLTYCGGSEDAFTAGGQFAVGPWYYVVATKAPGAIQPNSQIYINGVNVTANQGIGTVTPSITNSSFYAGSLLGSSNYFSGDIDDLAVYDRVLTPTEISDLYTGDWFTVSLSSLGQYKSDGVTLIGEGDSTTESAVVFGADLQSSGTSTLQLQAEVKPAGIGFTGVANIAGGNSVSPSSTATTTFFGGSGSYHWQARAIDAQGDVSAWQSFGPSASSTDFIITSDREPLLSTPLFYDPDLVLYYRFEGNANDAGPYSNNGTASNVAFDLGEFGQAASFNGSDSSIVSATSSGITGDAAFSISAWIKLNSIPSGLSTISSLGQCTGGELVLFGVSGKSPGDLGLTYCGGSEDAFTTGNQFATGTWYYVVATKSPGAIQPNSQIYINGVNVTANQGIGTVTPSITNSSFYAGSLLGSSNYFSGDIDDLAVYDRVLTPTEIENLYSGGFPFYAQIENTSTLKLRNASNTSASILKTLPAGWIIQVVSSTNNSGNPIVSGGTHWFGVIDPTDGVTGWMAASDTSGQYISSYDGGAQAALEASSSDQITPGRSTGETDDYVLNAIHHYYENADTSSSLYSSDDSSTSTGDGTNELSIFKDRGLPESLIWGIAALESGGVNFNNEYIHFDYGHGVMQITPVPLFYDEPVNGSGTWNYMNNAPMPSNGSFIKIFPCAMYQTTTYANCYTYSGIQDPLQRDKSYKDYGYSNVSTTYKYYTNTAQSIYANVKDGMRILQSKLLNWFPTAPTSSVTSTDGHSYSPTDQEAITMTAAYYGNPNNTTSTCPYVGAVADRLDDITTYFANANTSMVSSTEVSQMHLAYSDRICAELHSPGNLVIEDSNGREVGVIDGKGVNTFPLAIYDPNGKWVEVFAAGTDNYTYKVVGTGKGEYGIDIDMSNNGKNVLVQGRNIPITTGETHAYSVDKNAILNNMGGGVTLNMTKPGSAAIGVDTLGEMPSGSSFATHVVEDRPFTPPPKPVPIPKPIPHLPVITPSVSLPIVPTSTMRIDTTTIMMATSSNLSDIKSSTISSSTNNN